MTPPAQTHKYDLKRSISDRPILGFWRLMTGFRAMYVGAIVLLAISAALNTTSFLLIGHFVDDVLGSPDFLSVVPWIAFGFIALALGQGLFGFLSGRLSAQTSEGLALRLRDYMFDHIQRLTFTYHDKTQTGELLQRATSDVDAVRRFFSEQAIGVGRIIILFSLNFGALLVLDWQLAWISVVAIPIIVIMSLFFFRRVSAAYEKFQEQDAIVSTILQENLSGVRVVKAFARQDYERNKFEGGNYEHYRRGYNFMLMHSTFWPVTDIICGIQVVVGYYVAARLVMDSTITLGTFLAYAGLLGSIINPMRNLGRLIVQMSTGLVSFTRVMTVIREEREPLTEAAYHPSGDIRGDIAYENVGFEYNTGDTVLSDISFSVQAGQTVALLGSTGSGKTSLVGLLPRFYEYTTGKITIDGIELEGLSPSLPAPPDWCCRAGTIPVLPHHS